MFIIMGGKFKYNYGDLIGPHQIKMLDRTRKNEKSKWWANFICPYDGNIFEARIDQVVCGNTKSCGCINKSRDLTGEKFGHLTVLCPTEERTHDRKIIWKCECDCINKTIVYTDTSSLKLGRTISCGCVQSKGEEKVITILNNLNIEYELQKKFNGCINPKTGYNLKFDFYLPDYNCCIEYDGEQHFKRTRFSHEDLKERQEKDEIKNIFCYNNNINLIRIPYTEYDILDEKLLLDLLKGE